MKTRLQMELIQKYEKIEIKALKMARSFKEQHNYDRAILFIELCIECCMKRKGENLVEARLSEIDLYRKYYSFTSDIFLLKARQLSASNPEAALKAAQESIKNSFRVMEWLKAENNAMPALLDDMLHKHDAAKIVFLECENTILKRQLKEKQTRLIELQAEKKNIVQNGYSIFMPRLGKPLQRVKESSHAEHEEEFVVHRAISNKG